MGEGGGGCRVGKVVGRNINGLHGCNGSALSGSNALLKGSHFIGKGWLIANGTWYTPQQGRNLGAGLHKAEDVVNKQKYVLMCLVPEIFRHGQSGQRDAHPDPRSFVHLSEYQGRFVQNPGMNHIIIQIIPFPGTFAYPREDRVAAVLHGDVVDQFHDQYGFSHAGPSEYADLAALGKRAEKIDGLDPGFQKFRRRPLLR